jgi:hypothetical protein
MLDIVIGTCRNAVLAVDVMEINSSVKGTLVVAKLPVRIALLPPCRVRGNDEEKRRGLAGVVPAGVCRAGSSETDAKTAKADSASKLER